MYKCTERGDRIKLKLGVGGEQGFNKLCPKINIHKDDMDLASRETYCYTTGTKLTYKSWICI